ncbi:MAG: thioredoxin domain-containing protein [Candidatus Gracilibacteria bacterium]|nr:thioredoxin domain-containing protein [Candidatus Gracilibacteria bacterium]
MSFKSIDDKIKIPLFSSNFNILIVIICTIVIVGTNYYTSKKTILEINNIIQQYEYNKTGGEDNYKIMMEIQKDQMNSYIENLKETNPEYIEIIKNKINNKKQAEVKTLSIEEIGVLQGTAPILGDKSADYSMIEFSDFDCKYCKEFHNENNLGLILEKNPKWNYIFKNMINSSNTYAILASKYGKCIEDKGGNDMYFNFISEMFKNTNLESINSFISENKLDNEELNNCINTEEVSISLEKEFGQGVYLGIKSTPSTVLINNNSGEYNIIEGTLTEEELETKISEFTK